MHGERRGMLAGLALGPRVERSMPPGTRCGSRAPRPAVRKELLRAEREGIPVERRLSRRQQCERQGWVARASVTLCDNKARST